MKKSLIYILLLLILPMGLFAQAVVTGSSGADGTYPRLGLAFTAINGAAQTGNNIVISITGTTTETVSAVLNAGTWNSINIHPAGSGLIISGNLAAPLIDLNGADNVTIDGSVSGTRDMIIDNTSTAATAGTSTIRFRNDAIGNTIKLCILKGSETVASSGIIFFSNTTGTTGNDGNSIDNNDITNSDDGNRPLNAIYSLGTAALENSGNTISNNNIYDFLNPGTGSYGIYLSTNNSGWTISGNSFYETASFVPTADVTYYVIRINNTGGDYSVSDNFIGGGDSSCGGPAWTKTIDFNNPFFGIYVTAGTGTTNNIQNNTIRNFDWSNSLNGGWTGIHVTRGNINIGTVTGNFVGDTTGTESIKVTASTSGNNVYGINIASPGDVNCRNNNIGSITVGNADDNNGCNFYGINKSATAGTTIISNNTIGSISTAGSILASSASSGNAQSVRGIYNSGTGTITIDNNTIANINNATTNSTTGTIGKINGIYSSSGTNTISGNKIHDLTIANANNQTNINAPVGGIVLNGPTGKKVIGNTIYNLSNSYDSFTGGVIGIYYTGSTANDTISGNFIHNLSVNPSSVSAYIYGIRMNTGGNTWSNNIISLGGDTETTIYGIYETGLSDSGNNLFFNTVYIGGNLASGAGNRSYALYSAVNTNTRDFRNNIFDNARSTVGGTNLHYAAYIVATGGTITCNFNDYRASGTGGILGYYGAGKTTLPIVDAPQDGASLAADPQFPGPGGTAPADYIPGNCSLPAVWGTGITKDYTGATRLNPTSMGALHITVCLNVEVYKANILQASYSNLKAAFDSINSGFHTGSLEIRINGSTTESASAVLNASGTGNANYTSVIIHPKTPGVTILGDLPAPLIDLNGADNVIIDGRVDASGNTKDMVITNTNTSATAGTSTIRLINGASNNIIKYSKIKGSTTDASAGILFFSTSGTSGNDGNTIDNNDITSSMDAGRPRNAIYSAGTASIENSGDTIRYNNIYDNLNKGVTSYGIYLAANNSAWTISRNSFYETASFVPTASVTYYGIRINTGVDYSVSDNFIGGSAPQCGSSPLIKTNAFNNTFYGIYLSAGTTSVSNIQHNRITNIDWSNSLNGNWTGIHIAAGDVNIGNAGINTGNTIGGATGTDSVLVTCSTTGNNVYGINIASPGTVNCLNNKIGAITVANSDAANGCNFYGIYKSASAGITTISNNIIGSTSTANSIFASSASTAYAQTVRGIYNAGNEAITISGNIIANLNNGTTNTTDATIGRINGIYSSSGTNTISGNQIYDLKISNANNATNTNAAVCGIALSGPYVRDISDNSIYNLSNTFSSFTGVLIGLYFTGSTVSNTITRNFIHSISSPSSSSATIYGIRMNTGSSIWSNNIINLGDNTTTTFYGIYETGGAGNDNDLIFNTVYIGGAPTAGSLASYALYSSTNTNTRNFVNNIFVNARSNSGASGKNYAIRLGGNATITINYNDYYAPGTDGVLGSLAGDKTTLGAWRTATGQDAQSQSLDPLFITAGGTLAADYVPKGILTGVDGTVITIDFGQITRGSPPTMGAWEGISDNIWKGAISDDWATPANWSGAAVPAIDASIAFDASPVNNLRMDADHSVDNIINTTSYQVITDGHKLTIKGSLIFSNGALIDASASSSAIEYAGPVSQSILPGSFLNDQVYDLTINNSNNVILNGNLNLLNVLSTTSGVLDATTATPTLTYGGTSIQTLTDSPFLDGRLYNLTIDNSTGVSLNSDLTIDNSLTINAGKLFVIAAPNTLMVPGTITNNAGTAGLVIKSDGYGNDAKLINGSPSVNASVELYLDGGLSPYGKRHHYFVPPVQSMTVGSTIPEVNTNLNVTHFDGTLLSYDESKGITARDQGWQYFDGYNGTTPFANNAIISGKGYDIYFTQNDKITFKGVLNAGEHSFVLNFTPGNADPGWNLIGNPYPCNYDLTGITELMGPAGDYVDNTIYYYTNHQDRVYNVGTGVGDATYTSILPPMQGFSVHVTAPVTINLPVTSKTTIGSGVPRSKSLTIDQKSSIRKFTLSLNNGEVANETYVCLLENATTGFDGDFDAYKLLRDSSNIPLIYTELNDVKYAINSVPEKITDPLTIPVTVVLKTAGTYKIEVPEFENLDGITVTLKHGNFETNLTKGSSYSFNSSAGTFTDFELIIGDKKSAADDAKPSIMELNTWYNDNYLYINCPDEILSDKGKLIIYDMQGKVEYNNPVSISAGETIQVPVNLAGGFYIIDLIVDNQSFKSKIVVF